MELNKITSELNFLGCTIRELKVLNNIVSLTPDVVKKFGMNVVPSEISINKETKYGKLILKITVELEQNCKNSGIIELVMEGAFTAPASVDEQTFKDLILINGATALYSIGRSKIENITATTFLEGKIIIPMINIYDFYKEKRNEQKEDNSR